MQSRSPPSTAPGTIPAVPLASLPCCQHCQAGHCLLSLYSLLPAAKGQYCSAWRQLPGVTALDQLLTWHKPGRREVDNVLKGEKKQEEGDSSLVKWQRQGGSPWAKHPFLAAQCEALVCALSGLCLAQKEKGVWLLEYAVFWWLSLAKEKYYHFKADSAFTEKQASCCSINVAYTFLKPLRWSWAERSVQCLIFSDPLDRQTASCQSLLAVRTSSIC